MIRYNKNNLKKIIVGVFLFSFLIILFGMGFVSADVKGTINTTTGATPFYTISFNPQNCTLNASQSCTLTWQVNATGALNIPFEFYGIADANDTNVTDVNSPKINITIAAMVTSATLSLSRVAVNGNVSVYGYLNTSDGASINNNNVSVYAGNTLLGITTTNRSGFYNYTFNLSVEGSYTIKVNATLNNIIGEKTANLAVYSSTNKGGAISTAIGDKPFYTNVSNPQTCLNMQSGGNCILTWWVNATGDIYSIYEFYATSESINYSENISSSNSQIINITITDITPPQINFTFPTPANGSTIYVNYTIINVTVNENVSSCILSWDPPVCDALGGNITTDGDYCVHTFYSNGSFNVTSNKTLEVLVVAGGGGGGGGYQSPGGGGGGAGGIIYNSSYNIISNESINVTIGLGGAGGIADSASGSYVRASLGKNSTFGTIKAIGGGSGGVYEGVNGSNGGSGGGSSYGSGIGSGTSEQGNNGGNSVTDSSQNSGGGGGAGAVGGTPSGGSNSVSGLGGIGKNYSINGSNVYYAGGGSAGQGYNLNVQNPNPRTPGSLGGGGTGGRNVNPDLAGGNGSANTGGGGGGAGGIINTDSVSR